MTMMRKLSLAGLTISALAALHSWAVAQDLPDGRGGSFDVARRNIPLAEIRGAGPPRDGIPSLTDPAFVGQRRRQVFDLLGSSARRRPRRNRQGLPDQDPQLA